MKRLSARLVACLLALSFQFFVANPVHAKEFPEIVTTLDLARKDSVATDAFYTALTGLGRNPFYLSLTIKPDQASDEAGYTLTRDPLSLAPLSRTGSPVTEAAHICGNGVWGTIDNFRDVYKLAFRPFDDNHSAVEITVGDRRRYPFHNMICTTQGYTSAPRTPLLVEGHFVVSVATVPTAIIYTLFPFDPP